MTTSWDGLPEPGTIPFETMRAYLEQAPEADGWHLIDNLDPDDARELAKLSVRFLVEAKGEIARLKRQMAAILAPFGRAS